MSDSNNKRIAKNTLLLYCRTFLTMLVSLYISRIVLEELGIEDYGIYNVVGGLVAMFSILSGSLSAAISRFITFELGKGNKERLEKVFSSSVTIQIILALLVWILVEIIGVWFLNAKMNIPYARIEAANFVLQCSILTLIVNLISIPYNATIIAHEKMSAFAYISILEVLLKLSAAFLLYTSSWDKLKFYAVLLLCIALLIRLVYGIYCKYHFEEATYHLSLDRSILKEMTSFAGWSLFGNTAYLLNTQGVNMLINLYFGVTVNAARAIASQVEAAIGTFVGNFTIALNPPITKAYASGDREYMIELVNKGTKYSFFIIYLCIVPLVLETQIILSLWLKNVPEQSVVFVRLVAFSTLAMQMGNSMLAAILATGNIRRYQITVTLVGCMVFPLTWSAYKIGFSAMSTYVIFIIVYFFLNFIRLNALKRLMDFPVSLFLRTVMTRLILVAFISFLLPGLFVFLLSPSFLRFAIVVPISLLSTVGCIYFFGLDCNEKVYLKSKISILIRNKTAKYLTK